MLNTKKTSKKSIILITILISTIILCGQFFAFSLLFVISGSMEPKIPKNSIVLIDKTAPFNGLGVGDVIAFKSRAMDGKSALHRIIAKTENGFYTKGDASATVDSQIVTKSDYLGKCVFTFSLLALYLRLLSTPLGVLIYLIFPILITMLVGFIVRLIKKERQ